MARLQPQAGSDRCWLIEAEHPQGLPDFSVTVPKCSGDVFHIRETKQTHHYVAQGRHHLWCAVLANLGAVFVKRAVTHVMNPVLDRPMPTIKPQDIFRRCLLHTQAGDTERYLLGRLATRQHVAMKVRGRSFDTNHLLNVRKTHVVVEFRTGPDFSCFDPAMALIHGGVLRGEKPPSGGL